MRPALHRGPTPKEFSTSTGSSPAATQRPPAYRPLGAIDTIALLLMIVGGLNWALVGLTQFDLVAALLGPMTVASRAVYVLVGIAAVWGIVMLVRRSATH